MRCNGTHLSEIGCETLPIRNLQVCAPLTDRGKISPRQAVLKEPWTWLLQGGAFWLLQAFPYARNLHTKTSEGSLFCLCWVKGHFSITHMAGYLFVMQSY